MIRRFVFVAAALSALAGGPLSKEPAGTTVRLTARETEVLHLIALGHRTKDIARELGISPATVKTYAARIFNKLGASDRASAVAEALRRRLIE